MNRLPACRVVALCCSVTLLLLAGCAHRGAVVKGKVVLPAGLKLADDDDLEISLAPEDPKGAGGGGAKVDSKDLTFAVKGGENKGIPGGKYKVSVVFQPYKHDTESLARKKKFDDALAPFQADKTTLTVELPGEGEQQITVDLMNKTVSK